jgi:hypothetical protein
MTGRRKLAREEIHKWIDAICGKFKAKPGDKPFAEQWAEYKREEKGLEERKFQRLAIRNSSRSKKKSKSTGLRNKRMAGSDGFSRTT